MEPEEALDHPVFVDSLPGITICSTVEMHHRCRIDRLLIEQGSVPSPRIPSVIAHQREHRTTMHDPIKEGEHHIPLLMRLGTDITIFGHRAVERRGLQPAQLDQSLRHDAVLIAEDIFEPVPVVIRDLFLQILLIQIIPGDQLLCEICKDLPDMITFRSSVKIDDQRQDRLSDPLG